MRLISLTLRYYRQFVAGGITFERGILGISGPNGAGKTKIVEAIGYALFGPRSAILHKDHTTDLLSVAAPNGSKPSVTLVFEIGGTEYSLLRSPGSVRLSAGGVVQADSPSGVGAEVQRLLRLNVDTYLGSFVAQQNEIAKLQKMDRQDRQGIVNRLIGVSQVERAILLAEAEAATRKGALAGATDPNRLTVAAATAAVGDRQWEAADQRKVVQELEPFLEQTHQRKRDAGDALEKLRRKVQQAESVTGEIQALETACDALRQRCERVESDAGILGQDEKDASHALEVLQATVDTAGELAVLDSLGAIAQDEEALATCEADITSRLLPDIQRYLDLKREEQRLARRVTWLQGIVSAAQVKAANATAVEDEWRRAVEKVSGQRENAVRLGPEGQCEACGGTFGDRLDEAVAHLEREEEACRERHRQEHLRAEKVTAQLARFEQELRSAHAGQEKVHSKIGEAEAIPGELKAAESRQQSLESAIQNARMRLPGKFRQAAYDVARHAELQRLAADWSRAEQTIARVGDLHARRQALDTERLSAESQRRETEARLTEARAKLQDLHVSSEEFHAAERVESEAAAAESEAGAQLEQARGDVRIAEERVRQAEQDLELARAADAREQAARRAWSVAQEVVNLLRTVLNTLAEEARPRMEELIMEALPALYGRRFTTVQLSNDFLLRADNGTGLHELEHFSGGEQTILSILFRVAIAQFCRERAGLDTGFLIFDEVFGNQDPEHRQALVAFLEHLRERYDQVVVINHIDEVTDQLDTVLRVVPAGPHVSTISPA